MCFRWEGQPTEQEQRKSAGQSDGGQTPDWGAKYKSIKWNKIRSLGLKQVIVSIRMILYRRDR